MRRLALLLAPFAFAVACGGADTTTTTTPTATTATTSPQPLADDKAPGSAVSKPATVLLVTRFNDVSKSIDAIDHVLKLPQSIRGLLEMGMKKEGMDFIQLAGSFDLVVSLDPNSRDKDPKFLWAFSLPLKNIDDAVAAAEKQGEEIRPTTPGSYRLKLKKGNMQCELTASVGDSPSRAVCSEQAAALADLTPYMARGLAGEPKKSADIWVRGELGPFKDRYMNLLKSKADSVIGEARGAMQGALNINDPDLLDAPGVIARELIAFGEDADAVELSFNLDDKKPEIKLTGALAFKGKSSWVTQLIASAGEKPEGPPELFFRLPKDATTASWSRAADPSLFSGIRKIMHKGLGALFAMPQTNRFMNDADKAAFVSWIDGIPSTSGVWVGASGSLTATKVPDQDLTAQQAVDEAKNIARRYVPWTIAGGDGDPTAFINWLKSTEDAVNRGVTDVKNVAGKDAVKKLGWLPTTKFTKDPAGWPKGSATLDVSVAFTSEDVWEFLPQNKSREIAGKWDRPAHPKGAAAKGSLTLRVAVVPDDAGHYWWGYSVDPEALKAKLTGALKGGATANTLASRTDLDSLKAHKGLGGFMSYGAILDTLKNGDMLSNSEKKDLETVVAKLPHKAQGSIFFFGSSSGGASPTLSLDLVIGKDAVEDLSSAVNQGFQMAMNGKTTGSSPPPQPKPAQPQPAPKR